MTEKIKDSINIPVWLMTIIISCFLSLILLEYNNLNNRMNRIELKLDNYIQKNISYAKK